MTQKFPLHAKYDRFPARLAQLEAGIAAGKIMKVDLDAIKYAFATAFDIAKKAFHTQYLALPAGRDVGNDNSAIYWAVPMYLNHANSGLKKLAKLKPSAETKTGYDETVAALKEAVELRALLEQAKPIMVKGRKPIAPEDRKLPKKPATERAATHEGECQCCGRKQKLPNGHLSLHGYTVDYGYFNGVCRGAGHLPFELDNKLALQMIDESVATEARLRKAAEDTLAETVDVANCHHLVEKDYGRFGRHEVWARVELVEKDGRVTGFTYNGETTELPYYQTNRATPTEYATARRLARSKDFLGAAKREKEYRQWQVERNKDWKARPENLVEIKWA